MTLLASSLDGQKSAQSVIAAAADCSPTACTISLELRIAAHVVLRRGFRMDYRGKHYTIVQGVGPHSWKWKVHLDDNRVKSREARSRDAAKNSVVWVIDKASQAKKKKLVAPRD